MQSMQDSTEKFIKEATHLTDADQPAVVALRHAAVVLDDPEKFTASLLAQWYKIYTELKNSRKGEEQETPDEADQFLKDLGI